MQVIYISIMDKDKNSQLIIDGPLYLLSDFFRIVNHENSNEENLGNENLEVLENVNTETKENIGQTKSPPGEEVGSSNS